jgi:hypothetical protein
VENLLLYLIIAAGFAMLLAGAYGAAPSLFPRRRTDAAGMHHAVGPIFALGGAFPLLQDDLGDASSASRPSVAIIEAPGADGPLDDDPLPDEADEDEAGQVDETLLMDLLLEIELLRGQMQGLRSELTLFAAKAAAVQPGPHPASAEPKRRARTQTTVDLPQPLRRHVVDLRKQRRSA